MTLPVRFFYGALTINPPKSQFAIIIIINIIIIESQRHNSCPSNQCGLRMLYLPSAIISVLQMTCCTKTPYLTSNWIMFWVFATESHSLIKLCLPQASASEAGSQRIAKVSKCFGKGLNKRHRTNSSWNSRRRVMSQSRPARTRSGKREQSTERVGRRVIGPAALRLHSSFHDVARRQSTTR